MSKALVYKATGEDVKEPAGYVLKELAQCTLASVSDTSNILDYLLKRLEKEAADVKFKTLRTMKYLCINGRPEFRLELQRSHERIRGHTQYRGQADALRGDAPSQRVREEAKELLQALFNAINVKSGATAGRIEGYSGGGGAERSNGDDGWSSNAAAAAAATVRAPSNNSQREDNSKMVGYGNNNYVGKRDEAYIDQLKARGAGTTNVPTTSSAPFRTYGSPAPYAGPSGEGSTRQRGQPGGVWANSSVDTTLHSRSGGFGAPASSSSASVVHSAPRTRSNGEYESKLIDAITAPTGVRPVPTADELSKFLVAFESLDKIAVAQLLVAKLAPNTAFASQMKALTVLEALLQQQQSEDVEDYICENPANLEDLEKGSNVQLKVKATKLLELTGLKEPAPPSHPQNSAAASYAATAQNSAPATDLLNIGDMSATSSGNNTNGAAKTAEPSFDFLDSQQHSHSVPAGGNDVNTMFGNMQIKETQPAPAAAAPLDIFSNAASAPKPAAAAASADPLAAFMSPNANANAAPAPAANSSLNNGDFLNSMINSAKIDPVQALLNSKSTTAQPQRSGVPFPATPSIYPPQSAYPPHAYPPGVYPPHPGMYPPSPYGYPNPAVGMYPPGVPVGYPMHPAAYPQNPAAGFPSPAPFPSPLPNLSKPLATSPLDFHVQAAKSSSPMPNVSPNNGIPAQPGSSSFGFISGGAANSKGDSFGFVNDLMKS